MARLRNPLLGGEPVYAINTVLQQIKYGGRKFLLFLRSLIYKTKNKKKLIDNS